jgi:hypothetical protein
MLCAINLHKQTESVCPCITVNIAAKGRAILQGGSLHGGAVHNGSLENLTALVCSVAVARNGKSLKAPCITQKNCSSANHSGVFVRELHFWYIQGKFKD